MSKILITGAAGFIGHFLVKEFVNDHDIVCLLRSNSKNLVRLDEFSGRIRIINHDIRQPYDNLFDELKDVEIILHAGGNPSAEASLNDPTAVVMDNVVGTLHLLELARKLSLKRFVYYSAGEIFGPIPVHTDSAETDAYNSVSPYSASKAGGEELCVAYAKAFGVPVSAIHITNTFGQRSQCNRLPVIAIRKLLNNEPIDIHIDRSGFVGGRRWFHAGDVARHTRFILDNQKTDCEKWNSSGPMWMTNQVFVEKIANVMGVQPKFNIVTTNRPGHEAYFSITPAKLYEQGYSDCVTIEQRLQETVDWYKENSQWLTRE
jgi:dTDP-glucose 4,6-dehydratase